MRAGPQKGGGWSVAAKTSPTHIIARRDPRGFVEVSSALTLPEFCCAHNHPHPPSPAAADEIVAFLGMGPHGTTRSVPAKAKQHTVLLAGVPCPPVSLRDCVYWGGGSRIAQESFAARCEFQRTVKFLVFVHPREESRFPQAYFFVFRDVLYLQRCIFAKILKF